MPKMSSMASQVKSRQLNANDKTTANKRNGIFKVKIKVFKISTLAKMKKV
jgi:hypothetical protein